MIVAKFNPHAMRRKVLIVRSGNELTSTSKHELRIDADDFAQVFANVPQADGALTERI